MAVGSSPGLRIAPAAQRSSERPSPRAAIIMILGSSTYPTRTIARTTPGWRCQLCRIGPCFAWFSLKNHCTKTSKLQAAARRFSVFRPFQP